MSPKRTWLVARSEFASYLRRPIFWVFVFLLTLTTWGLSTGGLTISSGDSSVGGDKAWLNSEFALTQIAIFLSFLLYSFFVSIMAGTTILRDDESGIQEILHATPLQPSEYAWGKFLGVLLASAAAATLHLAATILFFQILPIDNQEELRGPFRLASYLRPWILFVAPTTLFLAGTAFFVGERTRRAILAFFLPIALLLASAFFLWSWTPSWLSPQLNRLLMVLDPAGFRWLNQTWLTVDRGVEFYNQGRVSADLTLLLNRGWILLAGVLPLFLVPAHVRRHLAGETSSWRLPRLFRKHQKEPTLATPGTPPGTESTKRLEALEMRTRKPTKWSGITTIARAELVELRNQPGLYLFVLLILLQVIQQGAFAIGPFQTPLLLTSGTVAVRSFSMIATLICLLLLFYSVESLERERSSGISSVLFSTPLSTLAMLAGKSVASLVIAALIVFGAFLGGAITMLVQGKTPLELMPFFVVWGLLLMPTIFFWNAFVSASLAVTRSRYSTYAIGLSAIAATGYYALQGKMNWVFNWPLWGALRWSDLGLFALNSRQLLINRLLVLSAGVLLWILAVRLFPRRDRDAIHTMHRLHPRPLARSFLSVAPFLMLPLILAAVLARDVRTGFQGEPAKQTAKDYWSKNLTTWKDAALPELKHADLDVALYPSERRFEVSGTYRFLNDQETALLAIPLTVNPNWTDTEYRIGNEVIEPENREGLLVFSPKTALGPGEEIALQFKHQGQHPVGATKNGGGTDQFVLPSGVVLHAFSPTFLPLPGFQEGIGIDEDNTYEPKDFPKDFWKEQLDPAFGGASDFTTRVRITVPEDFIAHSVGELVSETQEGSRRSFVYESDYPVKLLNVVAGKWDVRKAQGTAVYYSPKHEFNIDVISDTLVAARKYYSEWFYPFPWKELRLSEFPNMAGYAQGFPTNITFSEGIGFLTRDDERTNAAFLVTAHEAAHQWWGNLVTPGAGPGGNVVSEGMAHYATILLFDEVLGEEARIEFTKRIEESYSDSRQVDSERPLVEIDGSRSGDGTVIYDKGGWVMWMLHNLMGKDAALAGLQELTRNVAHGPDYPVLQDLVETLRPYAPDSEAFEQFVSQWYFDVVVPEYRFEDVALQVLSEGRQRVSGTLHNRGTGLVTVEIAAVAGERFSEDSEYQEMRHEVVLGAGESVPFQFEVDFSPERLEVDPDAKVLQLNRDLAIVEI